MGVRITINEAQLMRNYEELMDKIYLQYFTHPTNIPYYELTEAERQELATMQATANGMAAQLKASGRSVKAAKFHGTPGICNGLPSKHR